jgi:phosphotransferase system  glucose/maltose/N-acetylglucosamine-specific IIC component
MQIIIAATVISILAAALAVWHAYKTHEKDH